MPPTHQNILDLISDIFHRRGAATYLGESVTVADHMLQTAAHAQAEAAPDPLIAAALLHDIGHFTTEYGQYAPDDTQDRNHEEEGAKMLTPFFPPEVTEPIRLHVAAKRYLCATTPTYLARLSPASQHTLKLQGGPMNAREMASFESNPHHIAAVRLRQWDDTGKIEGVSTRSYTEFLPLLQRLMRAQ